MNLRSRNKVSAEFNMSSLTDIIFLLLIFFMLTSTLVNPNALKLLLPSSDNKTKAKMNLTVSIDKELNYYVGKDKVAISQMAGILRNELKDTPDATVVLSAEQSVPIQNVVQVMNIANDLKIKMILATQPQK